MKVVVILLTIIQVTFSFFAKNYTSNSLTTHIFVPQIDADLGRYQINCKILVNKAVFLLMKRMLIQVLMESKIQ